MYQSQKCFLFFLLILRYPIDKDSQEFIKLESHMLNDLKNCPMCFENHSDFCKRIQLDYQFDDSLINNLNTIFGVRQNRILSKKTNSNKKIYAKYLARNYDFRDFHESSSENSLIEKLSERFLDEERLEGMQFCPKTNIQRFIDFFKTNFTEIEIWTHMNVNVQPILLPYLNTLGFPVPETLATCGFTTFQSADGTPLVNLYSTDFITKLKIARQLLIGALKFSEGFSEFRIYITDLNADNIVYNHSEDKLSFVDLDTVLIVDGHGGSKDIHKHEFLECYDCFAFSPTNICASSLSDLNIFAACQLLHENLKTDRTKGFLYPIPEQHAELENMLSECVVCKEGFCENRFKIATEMIKSVEDIIKSAS